MSTLRTQTTTTSNRYNAQRYELVVICEYTRTISLLAKNETEAKMLAENRLRKTSVNGFRDADNLRINGSLGDIEFIEVQEAL